MLNFHYSIPTEIFFGQGQIEVLAENIKKYGDRVLLVYGGGSIKRIGLYDEVVKILVENDILYWEYAGVEPNPRIGSVNEAINLAKANQVDLVLGVGGGSAIDAAKLIAAGYYYEGDAWDLVLDRTKISQALPIASILTLAATGTEMNSNSVISNPETKEKRGVGSPLMKPKFSILDPTYTYTVPAYHTAAGTIDIMSHIFEVYFSHTWSAYAQNRMAESLLRTCIHYGPIALAEPDNYEARANLMWASSLAINGLLTYGKETEWSVHAMEHELSAYYDLTHGIGLAILTPSWMEFILDEQTVDKFIDYGRYVWDMDISEIQQLESKQKKLESREDSSAPDIRKERDSLEERVLAAKLIFARESISKTKDFFRELGSPVTLTEVEIGTEHFREMAESAAALRKLGNFRTLSADDVYEIYKMSL